MNPSDKSSPQNPAPQAGDRQDPYRVKKAEQAEKQRAEDLLDEAVEESFPASDPVAPHAAREHVEKAEKIAERGVAPERPTPTAKPDKPSR